MSIDMRQWISERPVLRLWPREFFMLPRYDQEQPGWLDPGDRWRRLQPLDPHLKMGERRWLIGEAQEVNRFGRTIRIVWYRPIICIRAAS